jgi:hypothetical protein
MEETLERSPQRRDFLLWLGALGPPTAWLIYLETTYVIATLVSGDARQIWLHLVSALFVALTLSLGFVALSQWRKAGRKWPGDLEGGTVAHTRTLGAIGVLASVEFSLIIIASWIGFFMLNRS